MQDKLTTNAPLENLIVFVPTYNEKENVEQLYARVRGVSAQLPILFLDDNSPDGTGEILDEIAAQDGNVSIIHRSGKLGIGSAHKEGIEWAYRRGYRYLLTMDCDFTHSPEDIPLFMRCMETEDREVVVGSRYLNQDSLPGWNLGRRFLTHFGHFLTRRLLGVAQDASGAFRLYDLARIPRHFWSNVGSMGYSFFFESLFLLSTNGYRIGEIPIVLPARTYGHSKMAFSEAIRSGLRIISLFVQKKLAPNQFRIVEPVVDIDQKIHDPQAWDRYWELKSHSGSVIYDIVATIYRNLVIKRRLNSVIRQHLAPGARILHAGCGSGQVDFDLQNEMQITAVDISVPALNLYKRNNPKATAVQHADIFALPFESGSYDGAYNLGVVEHFPREDIRRILLEMARVVKPGGKIIIFWPHRHASSVAVLRCVHWVARKVFHSPLSLHPPEITLIPNRTYAENLARELAIPLVAYQFGPADLFVQAAVVFQRPEHSSGQAEAAPLG